MKSLLVFFLAAVLVTNSYTKVVPTQGLNEKLIKLIEKFKDTLKNGNETLGFPVMDPFSIKYHEFSADLNLFSGGMILRETELLGLSEYIVESANFAMVGLRVNTKLRWPKFKGKVNSYSIKGSLLNFIDIYGNGSLKFAFEDLSCSINISINTNKETKTLYINEIKSAISFEALQFSMDGLFNDQDLSDVISAIISDLGPTFVQTYQKKLTKKMNEIVKSKVNKVLSTLTLKDLLDSIKG